MATLPTSGPVITILLVSNQVKYLQRQSQDKSNHYILFKLLLCWAQPIGGALCDRHLDKVGAPDNSSTSITKNSDIWAGSKGLIGRTLVYKMCIVCILFLLAVHTLVLIVNFRDVLGETETYYWTSVFAQAWWILLYFLFDNLYFNELEEWKGECFAKIKNGKRGGLWQRKITFPLEEKIKKLMVYMWVVNHFWNCVVLRHSGTTSFFPW